MQKLKLNKLTKAEGSVTLPGSKSLTNRALLLSALSEGTTELKGVLRSDDTARMLEALQALGVNLSVDGDNVSVEGLGGGFKPEAAKDENKPLELFLGNAGTAMRPLCAALALSQGSYVLTGEPRMMQRPIGPLAEALKSMGCSIEYLNNDGYPPLAIKGSVPAVHEVGISGSTSSQFISALLMAAPLAGGLKLKVEGELISKPYAAMTVRLMERFGAEVKRDGWRSFAVSAKGYVSPGSFVVEGDASAATYFLAAGAVAGSVTVKGLGRDSVQGDARFADVLAEMGADIKWGENEVTCSKADQLHGIEIDMNDMPDAAMTLVPLALYTDSPVVVKNIASWRVKETDRILAMATEMRKLGVKVESGADYIALDASVREDGMELPCFDTYNDHRMAMAMSLAAFDRAVEINDPDCTSKTFPGYFAEFAKICS